MKEGILLTADTDSLTGLLEVLKDDVTVSGLLAAAAFPIAIGTVAEVEDAELTKLIFFESGTTEVLRQFPMLLASAAARTCSGWKNVPCAVFVSLVLQVFSAGLSCFQKHFLPNGQLPFALQYLQGFL